MRNDDGYSGTVDLLPSTNTLSGGECLVLTLSGCSLRGAESNGRGPRKLKRSLPT